jgi:hypothetical protein
MGNFKIEIEAVGGHGDDRTAKPGEPLDIDSSRNSPDGTALRLVRELGANASIVSATLTHWPDTTPIVDDLHRGIRAHGHFGESHPSKKWGAGFGDEPMLQWFQFGHLPPELQTVSRPFCHLAYQVVRTLPRNAERTVALRKLLEAKDAAVRAVLAGEQAPRG